MRKHEIVYRPASELKPYKNNARTHPKKQIDQLAASLKANRYFSPIVIDEADQILCGHGRLLAARKAGMTEVPTIQLVGLSEAQKRQIRIADNKIALNADWDPDLLKLELKQIQTIEPAFDFQIIGFESADLDRYVLGRTKGEEDEVPDPPQTPVTRLLDIWRLGPHRVGCGDCRDLNFMRRVIGSDLVDAAFLDPPYNVVINGNVVRAGRHAEFAMGSGEMSSEAFRAFLRGGLAACVEVSRPGAVHFICMDHRHFEDLSAACIGLYGERLNLAVWVKSNGGMGSLYRSRHELIFVMRVGTTPHLNAVQLGKHGRNRTNVWEYEGANSPKKSRRAELDFHPTVKPLVMVADALLDVTKQNDLVLDAYLGSGTTLLACERIDRRFRGMDIDPRYVDVTIQRWMDITGEMAVLESTGQTYAEVVAEREAAVVDDQAAS
jgi:DNA modification methylase